MNTQILNKCIEELKKDKPDLSYLRGILETLVDSVPGQAVTVSSFGTTNTPPMELISTTDAQSFKLTDEEKEQYEFMRRYNTGPVAELQ